jgi:uncharacterized protein (DUF3084 family)
MNNRNKFMVQRKYFLKFFNPLSEFKGSLQEHKLADLQTKYFQLEQSVESEAARIALGNTKRLEEEHQQLEADMQSLFSNNQFLAAKVQALTAQNDELIAANDQLKKDNKDLKNIVDQIKLQLAKDTKALLQYEDSEIRKGLIRLFRWTLG